MKKKRRYKSPYTSEFQKRDKTLKNLGYDSYADYLRSGLWHGIRERLMGGGKAKMCQVCDQNFATEVHHLSYKAAVLLGKNLSLLCLVCEHCHESITEDAKKRRVSQHNATRRVKKSFHGKSKKIVVSSNLPTKGQYRQYGVFGLQAQGAL